MADSAYRPQLFIVTPAGTKAVPLTPDEFVYGAKVVAGIEMRLLVLGGEPVLPSEIQVIHRDKLDEVRTFKIDIPDKSLAFFHLVRDPKRDSMLRRAFVKEALAFGVRAVDGEDPRYARSGQAKLWTRVRYAVRHTFEVHSRNGGYMPAYSLFANYAMPFIAQEWYPGQRHAGRELGSGTAGVRWGGSSGRI